MIRTTNKKILTAWFLLLPLLSFYSDLKAAEELRLEGVIVDAQAPQNSVAVLNGNLLKAGEKTKEHTVVEVFSDSVRVVNAAGEQRVIGLSSAKETKPLPAAADAELTNPENAVPENEAKPNLLGELLAMPSKMVGRVFEIRGLRDLAIVNNACVSYYNKKKTFPANFGELIEANLLAKSYESGLKGKYRIYFVRPPDPAQFGVHADPEKDKSLRFFYVGTDAVIRESSGKPAGPASPPHEY